MLLTCDAKSTAQTDALLATKAAESWVLATPTAKDDQLVGYSTTAEMTQAIADALVPYETEVQRDAAIAAALLHVGADGQRYCCGGGHHRSVGTGKVSCLSSLRRLLALGIMERGQPKHFWPANAQEAF
ncbi:unnamed protein product, partial [Symbiodinium microadriaticum]